MVSTTDSDAALVDAFDNPDPLLLPAFAVELLPLPADAADDAADAADAADDAGFADPADGAPELLPATDAAPLELLAADWLLAAAADDPFVPFSIRESASS